VVRAPHHHQSSPPATDLGYLLHKNPARLESFELSFGHAHVFYPEAACDRCTVALLLDVDPVGLVRNRRGPSGEGGALDQYVNERNSPALSGFRCIVLAGSTIRLPNLCRSVLTVFQRCYEGACHFECETNWHEWKDKAGLRSG